MTEHDVLVRAVEWALEQGLDIDCASPASGQAESVSDCRYRVERLLEHRGATGVRYLRDGPDLIAAAPDGTQWRFECKGAGAGTKPTLKNNFDRAVASLVSYYDLAPTMCVEHGLGERLVLVLALADIPEYRDHARSRTYPALRATLNIWILFVGDGGRIDELSPRS